MDDTNPPELAEGHQAAPERVQSTPLIRLENAEDVPAIRAVVQAAFGQTAEADIVDGLRLSSALTLSVVAVIGDRVVGHVAFSPLTVEGRQVALALAPMAVAPDRQRQGIGSALIRWSLDQCRRLGHGVVLVVGEPAYYRRFGFVPAAPFGFACPFPVPPEAFMLLELAPGTARGYRGMVCYRPEFGTS